MKCPNCQLPTKAEGAWCAGCVRSLTPQKKTAGAKNPDRRDKRRGQATALLRSKAIDELLSTELGARIAQDWDQTNWRRVEDRCQKIAAALNAAYDGTAFDRETLAEQRLIELWSEIDQCVEVDVNARRRVSKLIEVVALG